MAAKDISLLKLSEIRDELEKRGLPKTGVRAELINRLTAAYEREQAPPKAKEKEKSAEKSEKSEAKPAEEKKTSPSAKIIKLPKSASEDTSEAKKRRAEKFRTPLRLSESEKKKNRETRFGPIEKKQRTTTNGSKAKGGLDSSLLAARAERFSQKNSQPKLAAGSQAAKKEKEKPVSKPSADPEKSENKGEKKETDKS